MVCYGRGCGSGPMSGTILLVNLLVKVTGSAGPAVQGGYRVLGFFTTLVHSILATPELAPDACDQPLLWFQANHGGCSRSQVVAGGWQAYFCGRLGGSIMLDNVPFVVTLHERVGFFFVHRRQSRAVSTPKV